MHVLMLGWEFPPFITGGLGTACHGLTRALDARGVRVTFVLPESVSGMPSEASHVKLVRASDAASAGAEAVHPTTAPGFEHVEFLAVQAGFVSPYQTEPGFHPVADAAPPAAEPDSGSEVSPRAESNGARKAEAPSPASAGRGSRGPDYGGDIVGQAQEYARFSLRATRGLAFDVIHAHDWMTFPAGLMIARASGRPLVVHVHSTEFDRSGEHVNQGVYDIERRGMHGAMRVITVSQLTKNMVIRRYSVPDHKIEVVYNGVELEPGQMGMTGIDRRDQIVLYFGRITYQKGPEYFIRAAKRVLEVMDEVKFVVAGSGDQAQRMIQMAADLGIGHKVLFTGFLRGNDIKRVFGLADLYVMPSVSEPFGIAPLEAMGNDVPALISKSSGVSEVLSHVLKVDFWDVDDMANKIVAVLRYPPLQRTLQEHGALEVRGLTWDGAANRCEQVYHRVVHDMSHPRVSG